MVFSFRAGKIYTLICCCIVLLAGACAGNVWRSASPEVTVSEGRLLGTVVDDVNVFKGIPYAAPPLGELRWMPPKGLGPWDGVLPATDYAQNCAQIDPGLLWFELGVVSEDCLTLNVWSPAERSSDALPVMVWIHGGGYSNGSGNIARLNSPALAKQGVVLVTINYRLGVFGFLNHPAIAASQPEETIGNYGLLDVVAALQWVNRNISVFGGDPYNVTIFGESAGAGLVNMLMVMPSADGLFHRAISESASVGLAPDPYAGKRAGFLQPANKLGEDYVQKLGVENYQSESPELAAELRAMSMEQLLGVLEIKDRFTPIIDGVILPDQVGALTAAGKQHRVPYITGGNSWEASLGREIGGGFSPEFAARLVPQAEKELLYPGLDGDALADQIFGDLIVLSGSRYTAEQMVQTGVPVYSYFLSYIASARRDSQPGVAHTDDIAFVFQTLDNETDLPSITNRDREISELMSAYWVQFAKTGNPNGEGLPEWPAYDSASQWTLEIGDQIEVRENLFQSRMNFHIERGTGLMQKARK